MAIREDILLNTDKRLFYISNDIDNETMGKMCFNLLYLLQEDDNKEAKEKDFKREPIKIYINSYGGSVYDMWSLIDIILNAKSPIYTYCTGYAMSAAFTKYMDDKALNKNEPYMLFMNNPCTGIEADTIEELYTNFKIFVDGFCNQDIDMEVR